MSLALIHDGRPLAPHDLWTSWSFEPAVIGSLALSLFLYVAGLTALWKSAGKGHGIRKWEAVCFAGGWVILAVALVSPLHRLGGVLFSAHMAQHELLMAAAAPLLVVGRPLVAFLWAVPPAWRRVAGSWAAIAPVRRSWRLLTLALVAWTIHAAAIWIWHIPRLYQATLSSELMHSLQHLSFLGSALLFWWALLKTRDGRHGIPSAILYLFTTAVHTSLLGLLLAFSIHPWYPAYRAGTQAWGLSPLEDQQLAGLIMWIPAGVAYLIAALAIGASWLREPSRPRSSMRLRTGLLSMVLLVMLFGCQRSQALTPQAAARLTGGSPERGARQLRAYGCGTCHTIPGIPGARGTVGPALAGISGRTYIAGVLANTPENLIRWIQHPRNIDTLTAMPDLGVSEPVARDMASYLYTLR